MVSPKFSGQKENAGFNKADDFDSDREEKYFNIQDDQLSECENLVSHRDQVIKTFKPGNTAQV